VKKEGSRARFHFYRGVVATRDQRRGECYAGTPTGRGEKKKIAGFCKENTLSLEKKMRSQERRGRGTAGNLSGTHTEGKGVSLKREYPRKGSYYWRKREPLNEREGKKRLSSKMFKKGVQG